MRAQVNHHPPNENIIMKGLLKKVCYVGSMRLCHRRDVLEDNALRQVTAQTYASKCFYELTSKSCCFAKVQHARFSRSSASA